MKFAFYLFGLLLLVTACKKTSSTDNTLPSVPAKAPDGFTYTTFKTAQLNIRLLTNGNSPIKGVPVKLYATADKSHSKVLFMGISDANGYIKGSLNIPAYMDTLVVDPAYIGLVQNVHAFLKNNVLSLTIGGSEMVSGNVLAVATSNKVFAGLSSDVIGEAKYTYMGTYNSSGRPVNYLEPKPDVISDNLLSFANYSLPERSDVRVHHPQYLANNAVNNLVITEKSDVWVTFVSEGAGNKNSIGYYTYPTGKAPKTADEINEIFYILPNSSARNSDGDMHAGDKVKLGQFDAGITIGFVLFQDGWDNNKKVVKSNVAKYYTNDVLNPEATAELRKHTVLLNDKEEGLFLLGFEDLNRGTPDCDQDFNDIILYATSNPVTAISQEGVPPIDQPKDSDKDGVSDVFDEFPEDPTKAYTTYFPSADGWGTLAYEDLWPANGDYDLNDLVVNYRYTLVANAQNEVVQLTGEYDVVAAGASYEDGFGVEFPFSPDVVSKVTGQNLTGSYVKLAGNGVEAGQSKAVIIPFDNHHNLIRAVAGGSTYINTRPGDSRVTGSIAKVVVDFKSPVSLTALGNAPFNPFLISNLKRGYEVHLPGNTPTSLADNKLFNTGDDDYSAVGGKYYLGKNNQPWGLSFVETFNYVNEGTSIDKAYLHFNDWIKSGGKEYTDWYKNTGSGYREDKNIYRR